MLVERDKRPVQKMVKLRTPTNISHVYTITGQMVAFRDGLFEVSEEDAKPLFGAGFTIVRDE
jgi:hypothetical protein